jgi:hypothetical protein
MRHALQTGLVALACLTVASAFAGWAVRQQALAQAGGAMPLETAAQQDAFRSVADEFVAAAAAGDRAKAAGMLTLAGTAKAGPDGVERFLTGEVLPFFAEFKEMARSVTVTRTAEVTGFAFYMYMVTKADALRPFVIYVIEEDGARRVANVLVDRFVEDRHCAKVSGGWQCPDFSRN